MRSESRASPYVFTIHETPHSLNEWRKWHWSRQAKEKARWEEMVFFLLREKGNVSPRGLERVLIRAVLFFPVTRSSDKDNFTAVLAKWTQDALVRAGVIPDDSAGHCTFAPVGIVTGIKPMTIITIEAVEEVAA